MGDKIRVLLVEDNVSLSENVKELLTINGYEVCNIVDEAEAAFSVIEESSPDVVLVDIKLKGAKTGIDLADELRSTLNIPIIFLTSSSGREVISRVKHLKPDGFVIKPFSTETLITNIELAVQNFKTTTEEQGLVPSIRSGFSQEIFIRENGWLKKIIINDIDWLKAEGTYTHIFVAGKQFTLRNTVKEVMQKLPVNQFARIHKSFIVNLHKVEALSSAAVKIEKNEIPVGRNYYQDLLKNINKLSN